MRIHDELNNQIESFEKLAQKVTLEIIDNTVFQKASLSQVRGKAEASINELKDLAYRMKENMLTLKPEKHLTIEKVYRSVVEPLDDFGETISKETGEASIPREALEKLRRAVINGSELILLAKNIVADPSRSLTEIMRLKEIAEAKEYISMVSAPEALLTRIRSVLEEVEDLESAISILQSRLEGIRIKVDRIKDALKKIRSPSENLLKNL
ncbi:MAG TPA: hypothetical protein ENF56_04485 [Candidatus Bathyarchaeota archaeon]|nr:MAG: hypothetical protein CP083_00990 [Candidatus Bathyarchaeota archaeon B24-2]HDN63202.1 hypothetical protein [Candidatus Bathyarchaeota archaeon]